jgi:hypothetical protein
MAQKNGMSKNITQVTKKRNWATVCYPESAPKDWLEILKKSGVQAAISPLHDKDLNPDGSPKKPHWHILLVYAGPKTLGSVKEFCETFGGVQPQAIESVRGYYRYLTHKDNPEKAQYDEREVKVLNGFSILDFIELTKTEVNKIKQELLNIIRVNQILEYSTFIDFVQAEGTVEQFDVAVSNTMFFDRYITSYRYQEEKLRLTAKVDLSKLGEEAGQ